MMEAFRVGGYIPDPKSDKDYKFASFAPVLTRPAQPGVRNIIKELTPVSNQGQLSSCVANSTVDALEILLGLEDPSSVQQLSRLFVYYNARNYDDATRADAGTFIRNAFSSLRDFGVCREDDWPYNPSSVYLQPSINCYKEASDNRLAAFYRIDSSGDQLLDDVVNALDANHPVVFGTGVSKEFTQTFNAGPDVAFTAPASTVGNHAMIIVGYDTVPYLRFYVRNSWGPDWGDGTGHCWFSPDYVKSTMTSDLWVPTLVPPILT